MSSVCRERYLQLRAIDPDRYIYPTAIVPLDIPLVLNVVASTVTLIHFCVWLFYSSHRSNNARHLDRKCMQHTLKLQKCRLALSPCYLLFTSRFLLPTLYSLSVMTYFAVQFIMRCGYSVTSNMAFCTLSASIWAVMAMIMNAIFFGGIIIKNVLSHRYMVQDAQMHSQLHKRTTDNINPPPPPPVFPPS